MEYTPASPSSSSTAVSPYYTPSTPSDYSPSTPSSRAANTEYAPSTPSSSFAASPDYTPSIPSDYTPATPSSRADSTPDYIAETPSSRATSPPGIHPSDPVEPRRFHGQARVPEPDYTPSTPLPSSPRVSEAESRTSAYPKSAASRISAGRIQRQLAFSYGC